MGATRRESAAWIPALLAAQLPATSQLEFPTCDELYGGRRIHCAVGMTGTTCARWALEQPELDRTVVSLAYGWSEGTWRMYRASTGEHLFDDLPAPTTDADDSVVWSFAARAVEGTPLLVDHWFVGAGRDRECEVFRLLDPGLRVVWELDSQLPDVTLHARDEALERGHRGEALPPTGQAGRFDLVPAVGEPRSFRVQSDEQGGWRVEKLPIEGRAGFAPANAAVGR